MVFARPGSLLVAQLLAIGIMLAVSLIGWYALSQVRLLVQARATYYKERLLLEGLLHSAVSYCLENPKACLEDRYDMQAWQLLYDPWPSAALVEKIGNFQASVVIAIKEKRWYIAGTLQRGKEIVRRGSCTVQLSADKKYFMLDDWTIS